MTGKNAAVSGGFVKTAGTHFTLYGKPWYFGGTNAVFLTNSDSFPAADIPEFFCIQANQGARVVRVAAYLNGYGCNMCTKTPEPIQPKVGVFNEHVLQRLDGIVAAAKANGIRLIMTLGNFEDQWGEFLDQRKERRERVRAAKKKKKEGRETSPRHKTLTRPSLSSPPTPLSPLSQGGMQWYVDEVRGNGNEGSGGDKHFFYTDPAVRAAYKAYVKKVITRTNTKTGVAYKDEPTILGWEVLNEPHTKDEYERNGGAACANSPGGCVPGKLANTWINEMSTYIKSLDANHLVSTGEEGYRSDGDSTCCHNNWINGGFKGEDFTKNTALPNIDFATVHVYPDHWQIDQWEHTWIGPNYIADRAKVAHAAGKPIIMEEFGMENGYMNRDALLSYLTDTADANGYAGSLVWAVWSKNVPRVTCDGCSYDFQYGDEGTSAMLNMYDKMNTRSGYAV